MAIHLVHPDHPDTPWGVRPHPRSGTDSAVVLREHTRTTGHLTD